MPTDAIQAGPVLKMIDDSLVMRFPQALKITPVLSISTPPPGTTRARTPALGGFWPDLEASYYNYRRFASFLWGRDN